MADHMSEAHLERLVLLEVGRLQRRALGADIDIKKNEVARAYRLAASGELAAALTPFGREAVGAAMAVLKRHILTFGLGVGSPDLVGAVGGRWCSLELKTVVGALSEDQIAWHAAAKSRGMHVEVIRSVEEVGPALERARRGTST